MTDDENKKTQNHLDQFSQFNPITNNQQSQQSFLKISSMNFDLQSYNTHNFLKNFNEPLNDLKEQEQEQQQQQQLNSNSSGNRKKSSKMKIKFSSVQEEENNDKQDDEKNKDKNDLNQQDTNQNNQKNEIDSENIQMMFDQNNDKTIGLNINTFGQGEKFTNTENNINQDKSKYQITDGENENKQAEQRKNILNNNDNQNQKNLYELNEKSLISEGSRSYNTSTIDYIQNKEGAEFYKNYEKIRKIGRGGFGEVYEVISKKQNNVKRAVKEIEKSKIRSQEERYQLLQEIDIMKDLQHQNIIKIYEYYQDAEKVYIVMEFCNKGPILQQLIKKNRKFTENECKVIMKQIFSAVLYLHDKNIIHRDIKPENILIDGFISKNGEQQDIIKLIDYGLSTIKQSQKQKVNGVCGTPAYMAPEQFYNKYDKQVDLWSCGIVLYVLLANEMPYTIIQNDPLKQKEQIDKFMIGKSLKEKANLRELTDQAKDLLSKLLDKRINKRMTARRALEHPWFEYMPQQSISTQQLDENLQDIQFNIKVDEQEIQQKLKDAIYYYIANFQMPKEEVIQQNEIFKNLDKNMDGYLNFDEFKEGYKKVFKNMENYEEDLKKIFDKIDQNRDDKISLDEFKRATLKQKYKLNNIYIEEAFRIFDNNNDGFITIDEIIQTLKDNDNKQDYENLMIQLDVDGDGKISKEEFLQFMMGNQSINNSQQE